jgi:hypothetical protein
MAAIAAAALVVSSAGGQTVRAGNLIVTVEGGFTPHQLSKTEPGSITLSARSTIKTADGTHLPALKTLHLLFDRHTGAYTKGLPTCSVGKLLNTLTPDAKRTCGDALIGTGQAGAEIALPEQPPFFAKAPMLIFNGPPKNGRPVFVFHVHANVPAPTTFVTTGVLNPASGSYGTDVELKIPTIVSGQGSLSFAELSIHKTWTYKGEKRTLLYGTCPTGHFFVRGDLTFTDGFEMAGKVVRSCTPTK